MRPNLALSRYIMSTVPSTILVICFNAVCFDGRSLKMAGAWTDDRQTPEHVFNISSPSVPEDSGRLKISTAYT